MPSASTGEMSVALQQVGLSDDVNGQPPLWLLTLVRLHWDNSADSGCYLFACHVQFLLGSERRQHMFTTVASSFGIDSADLVLMLEDMMRLEGFLG